MLVPVAANVEHSREDADYSMNLVLNLRVGSTIKDAMSLDWSNVRPMLLVTSSTQLDYGTTLVDMAVWIRSRAYLIPMFAPYP